VAALAAFAFVALLAFSAPGWRSRSGGWVNADLLGFVSFAAGLPDQRFRGGHFALLI
jgi:hypothetical protein